MNKKAFFLAFVLIAGLLVALPVHAQEVLPGQIISINSPISAEVRAALDAWLQTPPSLAVYYAVTYSQETTTGTYISLVGLDIASPTDEWSIAGDEFGNDFIMWLDTVFVATDGTVSLPFTPSASSSAAFKLAAPITAPLTGAGGGSYVRFPWQPSKAVQFGILGIHSSDFGLGGNAVDLVSGSDMGSGAANDSVYASVGGEVTYICDYGDTIAVRLVGGGDSILYAHLLPNANLEIGHTFTAGARMGSLKHGTFSDECGNAFQQDDHWHLHWGFLMSGGKYSAEGCTLSGTSALAQWKCGNTTIKVLQFLYHYGNIGVNPETGTVGAHTGGEGAGGGPSFWVYFLDGVTGIFKALFLDSLPEHDVQLAQMFTGILTSIKVVFRISYMLLRGNLNLMPTVTFLVLGITTVIILRGVAVIVYIMRVIKSIPFVP